MKLLSTILLLATVTSAHAGVDLYYFSPKQVEHLPNLSFLEEFDSLAGPLQFDSDVPAAIKAQMLDDLKFIGSIQGGKASPLHQKIFGELDGKNYTKFFESHVRGVGMDDCGDSKAVACVIPFMNPRKMWLTPNFVNFTHPAIARLMILFHEARHTESGHGHWSHATCPEPFLDANGKDMTSIWTGSSLAGHPACDETPLGSYGSSTIMLKNIEKQCTNCSEKVRLDAGIYADNQLGRIIDDDARAEMLSDFKKLNGTLHIESTNLSSEEKQALTQEYARTPSEARNALGTIVYLLGKAAKTKADWNFLKKVVTEPTPKNLNADEVTLAYPALMALKLASRSQDKNAKLVLETGLQSKVPAIERLARQLLSRK